MTKNNYFELQIDDTKDSGVVIRLNTIDGCKLRICKIPRYLVFDQYGKEKEFIDIEYKAVK
jgi:hypothetical protein